MNTISAVRMQELTKQAEKAVAFLSNNKEAKARIMRQNLADMIEKEHEAQKAKFIADRIKLLVLATKVGGTVNTYSDGDQDVVLTVEQLQSFVNLLLENRNGNA